MKLSYLFLLFLVSLTFTLNYYNGLIGWNNDQYMPLIYSIEDDSYLQNDFYVQASKGYNSRFYFSHLNLLINRIFNNYNLTQILLMFVFIYGISLNIFFLTYFVFRKKDFALFSAVASIYASHVNLGSMQIISMFLSPNIISSFFILLGFNLIIRKRVILGYFLMGVSVLFQPIAGILMYTVFVGTHALVLWKRKKVRKIIFYGLKSLSFFLVAFWNIIPLFFLGMRTKVHDKADIVSFTIARFKHWVHSSPFTWSIITYIIFFLFVIIVYILFFKYIKSKKYREYSLIFTLFTLVYLAVGVVFVELIPITLVAKAQFFRVLIFFSTFGYILIFYHIFQRIKESNSILQKLFFILLTTLFFFDKFLVPLGLIVIFVDLLLPKFFNVLLKSKQVILFGIFSSFLVIVVGFDFLLQHFSKFFRVESNFIVYLILVLFYFVTFFIYFCNMIFLKKKILTTVLLVILSVGFVGLMIIKDNSLNRVCQPYSSALEFIKSTEKNTIFLIPPTWTSFRLCTNRAVVVDVTSVFSDDAILKWRERLIDITDEEALNKPFNKYTFNDLFHNKDKKTISELKAKYGFRYVVVYKPLQKIILSFNSVYEDQSIIIYEV